MRPHTPTLHTSQAGPTSPPETPTTGSPTFNRNPGPYGGRSSSKTHAMRRGLRPSSIQPLGGVGSQFAYARGVRPEEISPRSSSSSEEEEESDASASPPQSPLSDIPEIQHPVTRVAAALRIITTEANFSIEEMSDDEDDDMDSDSDERNVLRPSGFEYPESERSHSRPRPTREIDPEVLYRIQGLNCIESSDDDDSDISNDEQSDAMAAAIQQRRNERRHRRMTSGSISKRTVSDRASDSDREDLKPFDNGEAGPNPRRIRRKTERFSWLSSTTHQDIIYELKEPNSDAEVSLDENGSLARELPYYTYMAVDSE